MEISTLGTEKPHANLGLVTFERVIYLRPNQGTIAQILHRKEASDVAEEYRIVLERHKKMIMDELRKQARDLDADCIIGFRFEFKRLDLEFMAMIGYGTAVKFMAGLDINDKKEYNMSNNTITDTFSDGKTDFLSKTDLTPTMVPVPYDGSDDAEPVSSEANDGVLSEDGSTEDGALYPGDDAMSFEAPPASFQPPFLPLGTDVATDIQLDSIQKQSQDQEGMSLRQKPRLDIGGDSQMGVFRRRALKHDIEDS